MPEREHSEGRRIAEALSRRQVLSEQGVSDRWIEHCAWLAQEFRQLEGRLRELEAELVRSGLQPQDTLLL